MNTLKIAILSIAMASMMSCGTGNPEAREMQLVEHACTAKCTGGEHLYAHGEKGHICSPACKRIRDKKQS